MTDTMLLPSLPQNSVILSSFDAVYLVLGADQPAGTTFELLTHYGTAYTPGGAPRGYDVADPNPHLLKSAARALSKGAGGGTYLHVIHRYPHLLSQVLE